MTTEDTYTRPRPSAFAVALNYLSYAMLFAVCGAMLFLAWPMIHARLSSTPLDAPTAPLVLPTAQTQPAPARAPVVQPAPVQAPIVVQSVPAGYAPQPVSAPQAAPAVDAPAPKPVVIVLREGGGAPRATGSGACLVGKGARRCAK